MPDFGQSKFSTMVPHVSTGPIGVTTPCSSGSGTDVSHSNSRQSNEEVESGVDREIELAGNRQSDEEAEGQDEAVELDGDRQSNVQSFFATSTMTSLIPQKSSVVTIVQEKLMTKQQNSTLDSVSWNLFEYVLNLLVKSR